MLQRVLILGAKGMLGRALQRTKPETIELLSWDRQECDITNRAEVQEKIIPTRSQWIINCAAYNAVDDAEVQTDQAIAINGRAVEHLAEVVYTMHSRLVHISTDYVFDGTKEGGYSEIESPNPISQYGQSKRAGEEAALTEPGSIIVRTSRLFGAPGEGKKSFVDSIVLKSTQQDRIEVINEETSSPTFVEDLATELWRMVTAAPMEAGIYHRTNDGACTWYEFAKEIVALRKIECELVAVDSSYYKRAALRPKYSQLLSTKLPPLRHWKEALKEYLSEK